MSASTKQPGRQTNPSLMSTTRSKEAIDVGTIIIHRKQCLGSPRGSVGLGKSCVHWHIKQHVRMEEAVQRPTCQTQGHDRSEFERLKDGVGDGLAARCQRLPGLKIKKSRPSRPMPEPMSVSLAWKDSGRTRGMCCMSSFACRSQHPSVLGLECSRMPSRFPPSL